MFVFLVCLKPYLLLIVSVSCLADTGVETNSNCKSADCGGQAVEAQLYLAQGRCSPYLTHAEENSHLLPLKW